MSESFWTKQLLNFQQGQNYIHKNGKHPLSKMGPFLSLNLFKYFEVK